MADEILFRSGKLTVSRSQITAGSASIFYSNVSAVSIYEGRPFKLMAIGAVMACLPISLIVFMGRRLFGGMFPVTPLLILFIPMIGMAVFGLLFKVNTLLVTVDGSAVAVLNSKDPEELERAKMAIERAKREAVTNVRG